MSDEAAFLAALKANPADDTARLVYADWLDEHNEPQKAAYLRLVVEVARGGDHVAEHPEGVQLCAIAKQLMASWRLAAGSRFALILDRFTDGVKTIKWFREVTGDSLGEAKKAVEAAPYVLYACVPFEMAFAAYSTHPEESVVLRITPDARPRVPDDTEYQLSVSCSSFQRHMLAQPAYEKAERESLEALITFLITAGVAPNEGTLRTSLLEGRVVLPDVLALDHARARMGEFAALSRQYRHPRSWSLQIFTRSTLPFPSNQ